MGKEHLLDRIAGVVMELSKKDEVVGIGMGLPGMVSLDQTTVHYPPNLPYLDGGQCAQEVYSRTQLPCKIENDANIAALGSLYFGEGNSYDNFIMLTLGTGVGGGIIINGNYSKGLKVWRGN